MSPRRAYLLAVLGLFLCVAWLRSDLLIRYAHDTLRQIGEGGGARAKILLENGLLVLILLVPLVLIPRRGDFRRDSASVLAALAAGFLAEAWGTRTGLWSYYTGERPPGWIIPGWPLGALVVERLAAGARKVSSEEECRRGYWAFSAAFLAVFLFFTRPAWGEPGTWAVLAPLLGSLLWRPDYRADLRILGAGFLCALIADFWGTTNNCWAYYTRRGIYFGAFFDPVLVLACLKLARALGRKEPVSLR